MKKCPFCAVELQNEAINCLHCGERLKDSGDMINHDIIIGKCPQCEAEYDSFDIMCRKCGYIFKTKECPICKTENIITDIKCKNCGVLFNKYNKILESEINKLVTKEEDENYGTEINTANAEDDISKAQIDKKNNNKLSVKQTHDTVELESYQKQVLKGSLFFFGILIILILISGFGLLQFKNYKNKKTDEMSIPSKSDTIVDQAKEIRKIQTNDKFGTTTGVKNN